MKFIPIQIKNNKFNIILDTGCGTGVQFTDVVEDKIDFTLLENIEALNRDGSHRGWNKAIKIDQMSVFGEEFKNITTSIGNWSMYSSSKFNGLIGLSYFDSKVITLDYAGHRIGISSNPIDYTQLKEDKYVVLPLYKTTSQGQQHLLFFEANYNNQPIIVYLDTGKNYSYLYNPDCNSSMREKPTNYCTGRVEISYIFYFQILLYERWFRMKIIETERLYLRELRTTDKKELMKVLSNPESMEFYPNPVLQCKI